ncbi:MAG: class I SAM-dependent methyltransferase [Candidatus Bathyanammoxibius sp.]
MQSSAGNVKFFRDNVDFYSEEYRGYTLKPWERLIVEQLEDQSTGKDVLDVACGGGRVTIPLLRRNFDVVGTDFVPEFESRIRQHEDEFVGDFRFVTSDMLALPFPDSSFDAVTCINALVYLHDAREVQKCMSEMVRVLRPGGQLFITTWNLWHPMWGVSVVLNWLLHDGSEFGQTSPFWATDKRLNNSKTRMFVASRAVLRDACPPEMTVEIATGTQFAGNRGLLSRLHPILVVSGRKIAEK